MTNWWKLNATSVYTPSAPNYTKALSFGGTDYIDCGVVSAVENVSSFSMSVWVYPTNSGSKSIIGNWGNPYVGVQINTSSSKVDFFVDDSTTLGGYGSTSAGLSNNNWAHLVLVFDGSGSGNSGRLKGYINGVEQTLSYTGTIPATTAAPNRAFRIGDQHVYYGLIGNISNAAIWNTPLSASQVSTLFNFGTPETNISFSPISWWKLDNLTTGLLDSGSASNNGTNNGATDISSGVAVTPSWKIPSALPIPTINYTTALDFVSSESDYIQIPYNTNLTPQNGNFTISAWINTDNLSGWHPIWSTQNLSSGTKVVALHTYDNKVRATVGGSTNNPSYAGSWALFLDSTQSLITSTWYHIAVTFNMSGNAQIYINGSADNSGPIENPQTSWDTGDRFIGDGEGFWDGRISNISIFNTALGQPDITSLYNNGTPLSDMSSFTSLVSWWKLDTGGSTITDYGSGGNNGTNNGAALVTSDVFSGVIPSNGVSTTLPSTALQQSDLQFDSPYSNYSLSFDGAGDYIDCTDNDMFSFGNGATDLPFSISTWVNFVDVTDSMILSKHTTGQFEYSFLVMANDKLIFQLNSQLGSSLISRYYNTTITSYEGQWIHLVGTYDGSRSASGIKIYLNGTRVDDNDFISGTYVAMNNGTAPVEIGKRSTDYMNGKIDETAIFNTELTSAQVLEIYNNGRPKDLSTFSGTAPISWWRLGENAYFDNNSFVVPNSISGAPNGTGSGSITTMISADAPGTYANGIGTNLNILDRVGDAALSTSNSQSYNIIPSDISPYVPQYVGDQIANNFSMTFDGVNDYINVGNPTELQLTGAFSVSLWMKTNITGSRVIISKDSNTSNPRGFSVGFNNTYPGGYFVIFNGTTVYGAYINTSTPNYVDIRNDQWHHIVGVYTPSTSVALFIDGNLIQSNTTNIPASVNFVNDNLNIGRKPQSGGINYYQGELDEVAIFDTALNAGQIYNDIYQPTATGTNQTADLVNNPNLPNPVAWYRMGD